MQPFKDVKCLKFSKERVCFTVVRFNFSWKTKAFSRVFNHNLSFIILGGANKYRDQAKKLGYDKLGF